jgi:cyclic beta-1,2-glucan synthetase
MLYCAHADCGTGRSAGASYLPAEAVRAAIESHGRDLDATMPGRARSLAISQIASPKKIWFSTTMVRAFSVRSPTRNRVNAKESTLERAATDNAAKSDALAEIDAVIEVLTRSAAACEALGRRLSTLVAHTKTMFDTMDFGFLFDPTRKLFSIGYRVADNSLDPSCYDLLASEARLTSFIAIAKGDHPATHWFHLGRALTPVDRGSALVSWSGSMFEYLMPVLVMRSPSGSRLD